MPEIIKRKPVSYTAFSDNSSFHIGRQIVFEL